MTEEKKTKWCYSVNEENFNGSYDTEEEAHSEAQEHLDCDMEVGDTAEYWIGNPKPAEEFLRPDMVGQSIVEQVDEWLADDIGWDDHIVELTTAEATELGNMVIQYIRKVNGFRAYGIGQSTKHTYTKEAA
jgi:hypothetical protein